MSTASLDTSDDDKYAETCDVIFVCHMSTNPSVVLTVN